MTTVEQAFRAFVEELSKARHGYDYGDMDAETAWQSAIDTVQRAAEEALKSVAKETERD